jgi:hypothetical protein
MFYELNIPVKKKFIETFSNGCVIYTFYSGNSNA